MQFIIEFKNGMYKLFEYKYAQNLYKFNETVIHIFENQLNE